MKGNRSRASSSDFGRFQVLADIAIIEIRFSLSSLIAFQLLNWKGQKNKNKNKQKKEENFPLVACDMVNSANVVRRQVNQEA